MNSGWTKRDVGALSGKLVKTGRKYLNTDRDGKQTVVDEIKSVIGTFDPTPNPEWQHLTPDQRQILTGTLNGYRSKKLHDHEAQAYILRTIEGVLTKFSTDPAAPDGAGSYDRMADVSSALHDASRQVKRLAEAERDSLELIGWDPGALEAELAVAVQAVDRLRASLKMGRGEKYGSAEENRSRLIAAALASLWRVKLDLPTGPNSTLQSFYETVCDQLKIAPVGPAAMRSITSNSGKSKK